MQRIWPAWWTCRSQTWQGTLSWWRAGSTRGEQGLCLPAWPSASSILGQRAPPAQLHASSHSASLKRRAAQRASPPGPPPPGALPLEHSCLRRALYWQSLKTADDAAKSSHSPTGTNLFRGPGFSACPLPTWPLLVLPKPCLVVFRWPLVPS